MVNILYNVYNFKGGVRTYICVGVVYSTYILPVQSILERTGAHLLVHHESNNITFYRIGLKALVIVKD